MLWFIMSTIQETEIDLCKTLTITCKSSVSLTMSCQISFRRWLRPEGKDFVFNKILLRYRLSQNFFFFINKADALLENLTDDSISQLHICDYFPLFDENFRHIELCNRVISQIQRNPPKLFYQCRVSGFPGDYPWIPFAYATGQSRY